MSSSSGNRRKNPYGYQKDATYSSIEFKELLQAGGISNEETDAVITNIRRLQQKYMNVKYTCTDQQASLELLQNELEKEHSHVFRGQHGPHHLYFATRCVMQIHNRERKKFLVRQRHQATLDSVRLGHLGTPYVLLPAKSTQSKVNTCSPDTNNDGVPIEPYAVTHTKAVVMDLTRTGSPVIICNPPTSTSRIIPRASTASSITSQALSRTNSTPALQNSNSLRAHSLRPHITDPMAHADIRVFLNTCRPPMVQYLQHFVDYGLVGIYLRAVSLWPPDRRYILLRNVLGSNHSGSGPFEIEIAVLENHFATYLWHD